VYARPVLLVAGICGPFTRAACEWLAERIRDGSILTGPLLSSAAAFVLGFRFVATTGEVTGVTVMDTIP